MGVSLLFLGAGIPVLARDQKRLLATRVAEEQQERKNRFRDLLREEFRSKVAGQVDIVALAIECGVTQEEADSVADELYRRKANKILANGTITPEDQRKLRILAKALRITADRRGRLEAEITSVSHPHMPTLSLCRASPRPIVKSLPSGHRSRRADRPSLHPHIGRTGDFSSNTVRCSEVSRISPRDKPGP